MPHTLPAYDTLIDALGMDLHRAQKLIAVEHAMRIACKSFTQRSSINQLEQSVLTHELEQELGELKAFRDSYERLEVFGDIRTHGRHVHVKKRLIAEASPNAKEELAELQNPSEPASNALNDIDASRTAIALGEESAASHPITSDAFIQIHQALFKGTEREKLAGRLRTSTVQLGGGRFHKAGAPYHTPPVKELDEHLSALAAFCSHDDLPAVIQAALVVPLLMFTSPFERGGGKLAQAAFQMVLARRGLVIDAPFPASLGLMTRHHDYEGLLGNAIDAVGTREYAKLVPWVDFIIDSCLIACETTKGFNTQMRELEEGWYERLGPRSNSGAKSLLLQLRGMPVFTVSMACDQIKRSPQRVAMAIEELVSMGVIEQYGDAKRNRLYCAPGFMAVYESIHGFE